MLQKRKSKIQREKENTTGCHILASINHLQWLKQNVVVQVPHASNFQTSPWLNNDLATVGFPDIKEKGSVLMGTRKQL